MLEELDELLLNQTTVACLEHMKWLGAFMCIPLSRRAWLALPPPRRRLFNWFKSINPQLLVASQELQQGRGLSLVGRTKALNPSIKTLLVVDDSSDGLVREALARGCDGICFHSERFMPALRVVAGGGVYYPQPVAVILRQAAPPRHWNP